MGMRYSTILPVGALVTALAFAGCTTEMDSLRDSSSNPLPAEWTGPYGGVPPFDQVEVAYFQPALEVAMAENLEEIERIATNPEAPTFENTIEELERRSEEHTSELQSRGHLVCSLLLEKN